MITDDHALMITIMITISYMIIDMHVIITVINKVIDIKQWS